MSENETKRDRGVDPAAAAADVRALLALLGFLVGTLDGWVFTLPRGYVQYCMVGIVTVNAMFLSRFFLWQYFYQMLYAMVPIMGLAWWFKRNVRRGRHQSAARPDRRSVIGSTE